MLILLAPPASARRNNAAIQSYNEGVKLYNAGKYQQAISSLDEAISQDPDFAEAYLARGACRRGLQMTDNAIMDLGDAYRKDPALLEARAMRGAVYAEADQFDPALEDFNYVLERKPDDAQSLFGRGLILLRRDDHASAARDFKRFLKIRPNDPSAPQLRKLLAAWSGQPASESRASPAAEDAPASRNTQAPRTTGKAPSADELTRQLLHSRTMSDAYGQKVLRGEKAEAVGDIRRVVEPK